MRKLEASPDDVSCSVEDRQSFLLADSLRKEIRAAGEKRDQVVLPAVNDGVVTAAAVPVPHPWPR